MTLRPAYAKRWSSDGFLMKPIPSPRSSCTLVLDRFVAPLTSEAVQALARARAWPGPFYCLAPMSSSRLVVSPQKVARRPQAVTNCQRLNVVSVQVIPEGTGLEFPPLRRTPVFMPRAVARDS